MEILRHFKQKLIIAFNGYYQIDAQYGNIDAVALK